MFGYIYKELRGLVVAQWFITQWSKPGALGSTSGNYQLFTFPYICLIAANKASSLISSHMGGTKFAS